MPSTLQRGLTVAQQERVMGALTSQVVDAQSKAKAAAERAEAEHAAADAAREQATHRADRHRDGLVALVESELEGDDGDDREQGGHYERAAAEAL